MILTLYAGCMMDECEGKYTNWRAGAPRVDDKRCVYITWSGRWSVDNCNNKRSYICEFRKNYFPFGDL